MPKRKKARQKPQKGLDKTQRKNKRRPSKALLGLVNEAQNRDKPKRGRRTTADNFLLGDRNAWLSFFERCCHEIGPSLLEIRKQRSSSMEEIRKIFEPLRGKPNCYLADCFLRGLPQPIKGKELRANRIRASSLHDEIQRMQSQRRELEFSRAQAENALKEAEEQDRKAIEVEAKKRRGRLQELDENLQRVEKESNELDKKVRDWETFFYSSQLLDFLCTGKYAVEPLALANALAGAPQMGWRQSLARCSKMPRSSSFVQYPYGVFKAILQIWESKSEDPRLSPIEHFRAEIPKLRKASGETHSYLSEGWRDLRMAIEECSKAGHSDEFMPYAITREFVKNRSRTKTQADLILDEHEKLSMQNSR